MGVLGVGAGVLASHLSLHRDITAIYRELANLREWMAKLEGVVEGFMRGQIPWDAAQTPLRELPVLSSGADAAERAGRWRY